MFKNALWKRFEKGNKKKRKKEGEKPLETSRSPPSPSPRPIPSPPLRRPLCSPPSAHSPGPQRVPFSPSSSLAVTRDPQVSLPSHLSFFLSARTRVKREYTGKPDPISQDLLPTTLTGPLQGRDPSPRYPPHFQSTKSSPSCPRVAVGTLRAGRDRRCNGGFCPWRFPRN